MSRSIIVLVLVVVIVVGALFGLSTMAREKPLTHVEKVVPLANLTK